MRSGRMSYMRSVILTCVFCLLFLMPRYLAAESLRDHLNRGTGGTGNGEVILRRPTAPENPIDADLRRFLDDPQGFLRREGQAFLDLLKREKPELAGRVEQMMHDYSRLQEAFVRFHHENLHGKTAEQLGKEAWNELRRRSQELRNLESSLKLVLAVEDLESLVREFRRNPALFLKEEADRLVRRLRERNPEKAKQLERLIEDYRAQAKELERQIREKVAGKRPEEIADLVRKELRTRSESMRQLEGRINELVTEVSGIRDTVEREIRERDLPGRLRRIENDFNTVKDEERRRAEEARRKIEEDINRILNIGHRRQ